MLAFANVGNTTVPQVRTRVDLRLLLVIERDERQRAVHRSTPAWSCGAATRN